MIIETLLGDQQMLVRIGRSVIALVIGVILTRAVLMPATQRLLFKRKDEKALHSIVNIVGILGLFLSFTFSLQAGSFGNLTTLVGAMAAALTVAIGFGMREQVGNLVSGVFIHFDNPFIKGDYIKVGETEGVVKEIHLRDTVINGEGAEKTVVPNSTLMNSPLTNYTKGVKTKTSITLEINPEKLEETKKLILRTAESQNKVLEKPEPELVFKDLEENKAELHYWIKESRNSKQIRSQIMEEYLKKAQEQGIIESKKEE